MALVATKRFKMDRERRALPGDEITWKVTAAEKKDLIERGLVREEMSAKELKAAQAYQKRISDSEAVIAAAEVAVDQAMEAVQAAKTKEATEKAEADVKKAEKALADAQARHADLIGA